jgi:hypothetical protein
MATPLPYDNILDIGTLSCCFNDTSASYKFYWFLAILEAVEMGVHVIEKQRLFASMVANAWYTTNYYHLSFGKSDNLQNAIKHIIEIEDITIDESKESIIRKLLDSTNSAIAKTLRHFDNEVPHRFLSPWFSGKKGDKKAIYEASKEFNHECLYALHKDSVVVNPRWMSYLHDNTGILKAFCYWNLVQFIQKHNPNVPDIVNKIHSPFRRKGLNAQKKYFWDIVIQNHGPIECIYTKKPLNIKEYAVEHFVPFAFVSHDLIWNLIPADKSFNCSKSDKLPQLDAYFDPYFELQEFAFKTIYNSNPKNKLLQDYLTILPDLAAIKALSKDTLRERFLNNISPSVTIAANNGFEYMNC